MNAETQPPSPVEHILICGGGLAAHMTAAALSHQLPPSIRITLVETSEASGTDLFYGSVSSPTAYAFNLNSGLSEPNLLMESETAFSWGTKYVQWAEGSRSWIQCFQLPLPAVDGVLFHHYLAQQGIVQLERYLVGGAAARKGVFIHPPQKAGQAGQQLLARAEYGYQLDPFSSAKLFKSSTLAPRVRRTSGTLAAVESNENGIASIRLTDGQSLQADLYVDCTGPEASLLSASASPFIGDRRLSAAMTKMPSSQLGPPIREIVPRPFGWRSQTPLQGSIAHLTIYDPSCEDEALSEHGGGAERSAEVTIGRRAEAWTGNCVAIGHAARVVEPLTPAPLMLLQGDIERLMSLIPFSREMSFERREFNRRFADDHENAELFTRALFETNGHPVGPYWQAARAEPLNEKLARKIELFEDRGYLVAYDLEPFHPEDWTILHYGMGRRASRYDRTADRAQPNQVQNYLSTLKREIDNLVDGLPSHAAYMAELKRYLMQSRR
jgi:tryptophan halogenase